MTEPKRPREFYLTRGNDHGPDELTHICLRKYYADKNPLVLVERSEYDALLSQAMAMREALFCCAGLNDDYRAKSADKAFAAFDRFLAGDEK